MSSQLDTILLFGIGAIGVSILICLIVMLKRNKMSQVPVSRSNQNEQQVASHGRNFEFEQAIPPDIQIVILEERVMSDGETLPTEVGHKLEPIIRSIPALATLAASSGGLVRISFSPEVSKGLADGSFALMQRAGGFQATAVNSSGQVVGNGVLSLDRVVTSVAVASAFWQILSVVTAQKFLSDINRRLAGIEQGIRGLETWLDSQEQGNILGSMKYMSDLSRRNLSEISPDRFIAAKVQLEHIYHNSLQSIAANSKRADLAVKELVSKKFDGNLKENEAEFRRLIEAYFIPASYAIRFKLTAASSECLAAFVEKRTSREFERLDSIVQDAEDYLQKIKTDANHMMAKAALIEGGFLDSANAKEAKRKSIHSDIEALVASCEESIQRIISLRRDTRRIGVFAQEVKNKGLSIVAKLDSGGKVISLFSDRSKKDTGT